MSERDLTPKEARFVDEYLVDLNATQAAIRTGYSPRTAKQIGEEVLKRPQIAAAIEEAKRARSERTQVDADWVLNLLRAQAEADLADLFDKRGALKPVHEWPRVWRTGLVVGLDAYEEAARADPKAKDKADDKIIVGTARKVRLVDRTRVVELIGKHISVAAFRELLGHSGPKGGPIETTTPKPLSSFTDQDLEEVLAQRLAAKNGGTVPDDQR